MIKITKDVLFDLMPYTAEKLELLGVPRFNRKGWTKKLLGQPLNPELEKYLSSKTKD